MAMGHWHLEHAPGEAGFVECFGGTSLAHGKRRRALAAAIVTGGKEGGSGTGSPGLQASVFLAG